MKRRDFLAAAGAAAGLPYLVPSGVLGQPGTKGANEKLCFGHIGVGGMGNYHLDDMNARAQRGEVTIAALCDVDENRLAAASKKVPGADVFRDYRYVLQRKDVDAVVIATPDHWHGVQTVHAAECGKHVYVEKPACCTIEEGKAMVAAARKNNVSVQVGSQGRSQPDCHAACTYVRNGMLGKISRVTCWHYASPGDDNPVPDCDPPKELDWDLWLGPMRWRPYNPRYLHGVFRWLLESGGGQIRDRGAHVMSCALYLMDSDQTGPVTIEAKGTAPSKGLWDSAVEMEVTYTFKDPDWTLVWAQPGDKLGNTECGQVFWGDNGRLILEWEGAMKPAEPEAVNFKVPPGGVEIQRTAEYEDFNLNHKADWFKAIKTGTLPAVDIEIAHRTATLCNLGNLSYILGRKLVWDGEKQEVVDDAAANRLLGRPQRHPYHL